ncbi:hypothetical protein DVH24_031395 [Malus domestica]|uniref:Uncharacterized protein n=1 Tax=Malus domestica TaxID=3750 RepID=A0A498HGQ9_MALDO|nr:hypothetical protein DVH24_031395 [Malus domestica]
MVNGIEVVAFIAYSFRTLCDEGFVAQRLCATKALSAMQNNCPTAEWRSWKFVSEDMKKTMMDQLFFWRELLLLNYEELMGIQKLDIRNKFMHDVRVLLRDKCSADWESWRAVPEEIKMHLVNVLEPDWDIDQSDPNLMKCIDNIFKSSFREWKFDVECETELNRIPKPPTA